MKRKLIRILIGLLIAALLLGGGIVLAYNVIWSGTANIIVETPTPTTTTTPPSLPLEVVQIYVGMGSGGQHDGTVSGDVWTFSSADDPTGSGTLHVKVYNPRSTPATLQSFVNGVSTPLEPITIAPGVKARAYKAEVTISAGATTLFTFTITIDTSIATPGELPSVQLLIREA